MLIWPYHDIVESELFFVLDELSFLCYQNNAGTATTSLPLTKTHKPTGAITCHHAQ
jgi:hypothetical protein